MKKKILILLVLIIGLTITGCFKKDTKKENDNNLQSVEKPIISLAGGTYTTIQSVTIKTETIGATIHYTTNGAIPTMKSAVYTTTISISLTTTVKAIAVKNGMNNSGISEAIYILAVKSSDASLKSLLINNGAVVLTASPTFGAVNAVYSAVIENSMASIVVSAVPNSPKAVVEAAGIRSMKIGENWFSIFVTAEDGTKIRYSLQIIRKDVAGVKAESPVCNPIGGTYAEDQSVTITSATKGAQIYYTNNGDVPTTSSALYSAPISITANTTLKAIAVKIGIENSDITETNYTILPSTDATLKSILINDGEVVLTPAFSSSIFSYSATVANNIVSVIINATTNSAKAKVSGVGTKSMASGANVFDLVVTAENGTTKTYGITITRLEPVFSRLMQVGTNFHNIMWSGPGNYYKSNSINWATETNPWLPAFLSDLAPFTGPLRFMDFDNINWNPIIHWSDRVHKTDDQWKLASYIAEGAYKKIPVDLSIQDYFPGSTTVSYYGVAYEWMIDLCNRTGRDMWICVPTFADDDYINQLAVLINSQLKPELKCYVEYSNETWNGGFTASNYTIDKGVEMGLPGSNKWYQGGAYSVLRSVQIFKIFQDTFGASNTGFDKRLVRVLSAGGNGDIAIKAIQNIIYDGVTRMNYSDINFNTKYNPYGQKPDLFAIAPYVGSGIDGAALDVETLFRNVTDATYTNGIANYITAVGNKFNYPIGTYEGGQHLLTNADIWSRNPLIYEGYTYMLNRWKDSGLVLFMQYTLYSNFNSGGAWGAKEGAAKTTAESPKYRALVDWINANK